jgi:hypothetical protein
MWKRIERIRLDQNRDRCCALVNMVPLSFLKSVDIGVRLFQTSTMLRSQPTLNCME